MKVVPHLSYDPSLREISTKSSLAHRVLEPNLKVG